MTAFILIVLCYLIGSVSFSYILTKLLTKEDIRKHGSGNAGTTNTLRVLGRGPAIIVLLLDVLKGIIAVLIMEKMGYTSFMGMIGGLAAVIGHNYPVFFGFKGGKGFATAIGVFAVISFLPSLIAGLITLIVIFVSRFVSLGAIVFLIFTPFFMLYNFYTPLKTILVAICLSILCIWKHRDNIHRLRNGTERKIKF